MLTSCASNTILSESIIFADRFNQDITEPHLITMGTVSGNLAMRATAYGREQFPRDTTDDPNYQDFNPGFGAALGVATKRFAVAVSIQPIMIGADISVIPLNQVCVTAVVTSSQSLAASCLLRFNGSTAIGPFFRRDRYQGLGGGQFLEYVSRSAWERHYVAESIGLKCHIRNEDYDGSERIYFVGLGYSPKLKSFLLSIGLNRISIH